MDDCILAGYSVFTPGPACEAVSYTTRGDVRADLQFKQPLPDGFRRIGTWPAELFLQMASPSGEKPTQ